MRRSDGQVTLIGFFWNPVSSFDQSCVERSAVVGDANVVLVWSTRYVAALATFSVL
jgi:hypothetical protein